MFQNKGFAILIMILMIIGSTLLGSHRSLINLSNKTAEIFINGINKDGMSIQSDLNDRCEYANNLLKISYNYLGASSTEVEAVKKSIDDLSMSKSISDKYRYNLALTAAVNELYSSIEKQSLSDKDKKNSTSQFINFNSCNDTISHDKYNELALEYNNTLKKFPANLLSRLTFIKPLNLFN